MKIFARDLKSPELRGFVETNGERLSAEDGTEDWAVDAEELTDCFVRFARLFTQAETGITLVDAAVKDWPVFSSEAAARRVLGAVFEKQSLDFALTDKVTLRPDLESGVATWQRLKREVREEKRFFANFYASELDEWLSPQGWLKQGTDFFRARIVPKGEQAWGTDDMGCPPVDKASGGRANPEGIPYLYLSEQCETTLYEVRAAYLDRVSIGHFKLQRDLSVVNFAEMDDIFDAYFADNSAFETVVRKNRTLKAIGFDLSRPLRRFDNPLVEYTPTQAVCEFCKLHDAAGIRFCSSQHPGGINVVLFDDDDADCVDVETVEVKRVHLEFQLIG